MSEQFFRMHVNVRICARRCLRIHTGEKSCMIADDSAERLSLCCRNISNRDVGSMDHHSFFDRRRF